MVTVELPHITVTGSFNTNQVLKVTNSTECSRTQEQLGRPTGQLEKSPVILCSTQRNLGFILLARGRFAEFKQGNSEDINN